MARGETLVVGAGPTGLTAAIGLARRGLPVRVIEKRDTASNLSRAVGILPPTVRALEALGAADEILQESLVVKRIQLSVRGRVLGHVDMSDAVAPDRRILALPQDRTEELLRKVVERLGGEIRFGAAFEGLEQDADGVTVRFGGTEERFDHVIGCDGVHSPTREALGIAYEGYDVPGDWSIADVDVGGDFDPHRVFIDPGDRRTGVTIAIPIGPTRTRIIAGRKDALEGLPFPIEVTHVRRTAPFTISIRQARDYVQGRVLLAGDAAHCHSPVGGRGMNLGMLDAVAAAEAIATGEIAEYGTARHREGAKTIRETERARRPVTSGHPLVPYALATIGFILKHSRAARRAFLRQATNF
ncbi:MAG: FAD-dependent oxidoreductase [Maritimibacter harenae]